MPSLRPSRFNTYDALNTTHRSLPFKNLVSSKQWKEFLVEGLGTTSYNVAIIPTNMEFRPDIIAFAAYGSVDLWWLICTANSIIDPNTELPAGKQIKIPII
tara:strand:- start:18878 stop:19180 length:303 start_codon:yes stop_codon:yes gene_type:complete